MTNVKEVATRLLDQTEEIKKWDRFGKKLSDSVIATANQAILSCLTDGCLEDVKDILQRNHRDHWNDDSYASKLLSAMNLAVLQKATADDKGLEYSRRQIICMEFLIKFQGPLPETVKDFIGDIVN